MAKNENQSSHELDALLAELMQDKKESEQPAKTEPPAAETAQEKGKAPAARPFTGSANGGLQFRSLPTDQSAGDQEPKPLQFRSMSTGYKQTPPPTSKPLNFQSVSTAQSDSGKAVSPENPEHPKRNVPNADISDTISLGKNASAPFASKPLPANKIGSEGMTETAEAEMHLPGISEKSVAAEDAAYDIKGISKKDLAAVAAEEMSTTQILESLAKAKKQAEQGAQEGKPAVTASQPEDTPEMPASQGESVSEEELAAAEAEQMSTTQVVESMNSGRQAEEDNKTAEEQTSGPEMAVQEESEEDSVPAGKAHKQPLQLNPLQKSRVQIDEKSLKEPVLKNGKSSWLGDQSVLRGDKKKKRKKRGHSVIGVVFRFLIVIVLVVAFAVGAMLVVYAAGDIFGLKESEEKITVNIPTNTSVSQVADLLKEKEIIEYPVVFRAYVKYKLNNNVNFNFGVFTLTPNMSYDELIAELERAVKSEEEVTVTIPEGFDVIEIASKLEENHVCTKEEFLKAINEEKFDYDILESAYENKDKKGYVLEGYLYPDTYNFIENSAPADVIKKFLDNFERKLSNSMRNSIEYKGYTMDEFLTLASIVQKEAPTKDNMGLVSSVYTNRLKSDEFPKLQADPTSGYADDVLLKNGFSQELSEAYDTYKSEGLPPGAIANPGMDAMEAALSPRTSDYYYFCSDLGTGEFYYAYSYDEHQANLVKAGLTE